MTTAHRPEPGTIPEWTLGWRLQRSLAHAGLTTQQIAKELGMTRSTISRWLNGHGHEPRLAYIRQWALITGVPVSWLVAGEEPVTRPDDGEEVTRINRGWYGMPDRRVAAGLGRAA